MSTMLAYMRIATYSHTCSHTDNRTHTLIHTPPGPGVPGRQLPGVPPPARAHPGVAPPPAAPGPGVPEVCVSVKRDLFIGKRDLE